MSIVIYWLIQLYLSIYLSLNSVSLTLSLSLFLALPLLLSPSLSDLAEALKLIYYFVQHRFFDAASTLERTREGHLKFVVSSSLVCPLRLD